MHTFGSKGEQIPNYGLLSNMQCGWFCKDRCDNEVNVAIGFTFGMEANSMHKHADAIMKML